MLLNSPAIEIFAIGTELAIGQIQDTNSAWLAQEVTRLGGRPRRLTVLSDDLEDIVRSLRDSLDRGTGILLVTGGLGPTPDDLTVEALCRLAGIPSEVHEPTVQDYIGRRGYKSREEVTPNLLKMATLPKGATVHANPVGWAPCIEVAVRDSVVLSMPGPPREMKGIFEAHVQRILSQRLQAKSATRRVWTSMYESEMSPHIQKVMQEFPGTYLKGYVALRSQERQAMPVDIVAHGKDEAEAASILEAATARLQELVLAAGKTLTLEEPGDVKRDG